MLTNEGLACARSRRAGGRAHVLVGMLWPKAESGVSWQGLARAARGHEPPCPAAAGGRAALLPANGASVPSSWLFLWYLARERSVQILQGGRAGWKQD